MIRTAACVASALLTFVLPAHARDTLTMGAERTHFTRGLGERTILSSHWKHHAGANTYLFGADVGERDFDATSHGGTRLSGTWYRTWNDTVSTRTAASIADDDPVFTRHQFEQDVTFRTSRRTNLTAGLRQSEYFGNGDVFALSLGGALYVDRIVLRYRYTHHDVAGQADGSAHLISARLADRRGAGATQLWIGASDTFQAFDWSPTALPGDGRSVALRRVQPLTDSLALKLAIERAWQDTPAGDYTASTVTVGLRIGL